MLLRLAFVVSLAALAGSTGGVHGASATTTHLRFYMHDVITAPPGRAATAVRITRGRTPVPVDPRIRFGDMYVIDDLLTEGPDPASPAVGRAQGFFLFASQTELAVLLTFNALFTTGPHNGSTIAVQSRDAFFDAVRELPVVGGTGAFRGVSGYGLLRTHVFDTSKMNAVLKIDFYLHH